VQNTVDIEKIIEELTSEGLEQRYFNERLKKRKRYQKEPTEGKKLAQFDQ
jgi:hypothetical protein